MQRRDYHHRCRVKSKAGFTLVEVLTVLGISALLVGLATMSLRGLGQGETLGMSGNKVASLLSFARQNSVSKNVMTAMVMVTDPTLGQRNGRTFALFEFDLPTDGTAPTSSDWQQITKWETIPIGVIVDQWVWNSAASPQPTPTLPTLETLPPLVVAGSPTTTFQSVIFLPTGNLFESNSYPLNIRLAPGLIPAGSSSIQYTTSFANGNPANYYQITVQSYTGQAKISRP